MNDHQRKALKEGSCEREWAQTSVSSREKTNTKRNLARVMTKSKSKMQTVTMDVSVEREMNCVVGECSNVGDLIE